MTTEQWRETTLEAMWWDITQGATKEGPPVAPWLCRRIWKTISQKLARLKEIILPLPTHKPSALEAYLMWLEIITDASTRVRGEKL